MNSRPFKFRFFSPKQNKFVHQPRLWVSDQGLLNYEYGEGEDLIITQWTGLVDKNKIEIFEGDIVKFKEIQQPERNIHKGFKESISPIEYINGSFWVNGLTTIGAACILLGTIEIIGNIFQKSLDKLKDLT